MCEAQRTTGAAGVVIDVDVDVDVDVVDVRVQADASMPASNKERLHNLNSHKNL